MSTAREQILAYMRTRDRARPVGMAETVEASQGAIYEALRVMAERGEQYAIADIGMRMLRPRELYRAQGFPESYVIDFDYQGKPLPKAAQVRMCGNSVSPPVATALVRANFTHEAAWRRKEVAA